MNDLTDGTPPEEDPGPSAAYSAASTASGRSLSNLWDWGRGDDEALIDRAAATQAWAQLARCFPHWRSAKRNLHSRALRRLAANKPVDPNDKANWSSSDAHATAVLRRHGISTIDSLKLSDSAVAALIHGQRAADEHAGVDWGRLHTPPSVIDDALREAHRTLPIDITDPQMWKWPEDQRRVLAETLGVDAVLADDLSRWALAHPDRFDTSTLRCWRIASGTWLKLAGEQLAPVETVERPVGVFIAPAIKQDGWSLEPCLSLDMVRLVAELGGHLERSLRDAVLPLHAGAELLARINNNTLHTGSKDMIESATQLSTDLSGLFDQTVRVSLTRDKRDRWGRVHVRKSTWKGNDGRARGELHLTVMTTTVKTFTTKRLGAARVDSLHGAVTRSAAMELGEAVNCAVERGLPLLLSSEAAGMLDGTVRVGRMKGRPGMITITSSDGVEATTARLVAEQAVSRLRALRDTDQRVILDAGAKQLVRMTVAKPLSDDPVLVGRQQEIAALMAVGSGVNASQTGTGKCLSADTNVLINGQLTAAQEVWAHNAGADAWFDGEGWWSRPRGRVTVNALDCWGQIVTAPVSWLYRQQVNEVGRRVTLDDGSTVTITKAHRLHSVDGWTADIKVGDFICVPRRLQIDETPIDPAVAELLAWQIAEGNEPVRGTARITQQDVAVLERLRTLAQRIGARHDIRMNGLPISTSTNSKASCLSINSTAYQEFLERELGYQWGQLSAHKKVPDTIMRADDTAACLFLRAYFDAEGSVAADRRVIEVTSASRMLIDQVSVLLRRFGIWMRIQRKRKAATNGSGIRRTYWTGYISGNSLRRFAAHVGFGTPRKASRLIAGCAATANTNVEGIPVKDIVDELKAAGCTYYLAQPADCVHGQTVGQTRAITMLRGYRQTVELVGDRVAQVGLDPRIRKVIRRLDADDVERGADRLHERLAREVFYARVARIEDVALTGWVYDLTVDEHHNFVAGGMLCHNTVVTARGALYQRAASTKGFRGLVVAEGRLLGQWLEEVTVGAPARGMPPLVPNARFHVLDERTSIAAQIRAFHRDCGTEAGVVLVPNSILDRYPGDLMVISWHLLVADEALRYVNPLTEAHRALRTVRMGAVADCWLLTATPKGKTSEHLDVLVGLAVGDDGMIRERLATREAGDLMDEINAHRLRVNYGPHLVRVTRADMKAWMPEVRPAEPIIVEPDSAMAELLEAIRKGGQDAYRRLLEVLRELKRLERGSGLHQQALVELSRCQGVVLGNVGVYVDASVDPETLKYSKAALAQALTRQGLVDAAMRGGGDGQPTLRGIVAQAIAGIVADEQVIVFADRVRCLHQLAGTLNDRHGIRTHVADGRIDEQDFEELKRGFVAGEFPVLCLSKIGQEGHNLQNASTIVELDLPWVPTGLEQRVGRSARPGNTRGYVATFIPYLKGGGVEHIVKILAERGGEHHQILDSFEGVAASDSTIATQLGAITAQVADSKQEAGYAGTAARLRVAATVFGAGA